MQKDSIERLDIDISTLDHYQGLPLPSYATSGSSGMDLLAALEEPVRLQPGSIALIPTGICVAIPSGFEMQIRPRSGLAIKHGVTVVNAPGTIDSDYRGEIKVGLINLGKEPFEITRGMRIAQAVIAMVVKVNWQKVQVLSDTKRGSGGFGHTGLK